MRQKISNTIIFFLPIVALLIILRNVLFKDHVFYSGDALLQFYQYFKLLAVSGGTNIAHAILAGFPMETSIAGGWYYPVNKLFIDLFGVIDGYHLLTFANMVAAYVATYAYARIIKLQHSTAVLVASIFIFSGQVMKWITVLPNTNYYFTLPIVLICAEVFWKQIFLQKKLNYLFAIIATIISGIFLGVSWLAAHTQFVVYIHAFLAFYFLFKYLGNRSLKYFILGGSGLGMIYLISAAIGYPAIRAILEFSQLSSRAAGVSTEEFFSSAYYVYDLIHYFIPFFNPPVIPVGALNLYIGIIPVLMLVLGLVVYRQIKSRTFRFYMIAFAFCLLAAFKYSPIGYFLHVLPFFDAFRSITRIMFIGHFAAAIAIGFVVELLLNNSALISDKCNKVLAIMRKIFVYLFVPAVILTSVIKLFFTSYLQTLSHDFFLKNIYPKTSGLPQEHYLRLIDQYINQGLDQLYVGYAPVIIFTIVGVLSWYILSHRSALKRNIVAGLLVVVMLLDVTAVYANRYQTFDQTILTEPASTARYLLEQDVDQYRIFSLFPGITEYNELQIGCPEHTIYDEAKLQQMMLTPNVNMWHSIDSVDGYENFMTNNTAELLAYIGSERATAGRLLATEEWSLEERVDEFVGRRNILRMMNVKYVLAHEGIDHPDFTKVFSDSVGPCNTEVSVYELSEPWPRYFLTTNIRPPSDTFEAVIAQLQSSQDLGTVVLEKDIELSGTKTSIVPVNPTWRGDTMSAAVETDQDVLFYVGNTWLPGWQARIDGQVVEILRANYNFMAIVVPAGEHEIIFEYSP